MKRDVYIQLNGESWVVVFAQRRKGQRYSAGQFYAPEHTRQFVEDWVKQNPKLNLVKPPALKQLDRIEAMLKELVGDRRVRKVEGERVDHTANMEHSEMTVEQYDQCEAEYKRRCQNIMETGEP